ncbi:hypothetical protein E2C01_100170 [Portunus trituberculatus]|uniref:Uncharacterized protein n=1 Tax=Portunus trituberculatus TaxID=210409 RepID=A0A5B7KH95_PORTR|nr:hypothetical protein [Portunus trituberculatus]
MSSQVPPQPVDVGTDPGGAVVNWGLVHLGNFTARPQSLGVASFSPGSGGSQGTNGMFPGDH